MYSRFRLAIKYLHYYLSASNGKGHGIHSPFVFSFVKNILNDTTKYEAYEKIESLRGQLLKNNDWVEMEDLGAGSAIASHKNRKVSQVARHSAKPRKYAQLIYRITRYYQPQTVIELGTSLGLTTAYLAMADARSTVRSLEGAHHIAAWAKKNVECLGLKNVILITGNFNVTLQPALSAMATVDLAFVDGNHRKAPTLLYFSDLLERMNPSSVFIFDDIHWSAEMEDAWETIKAHPAVTLSIDLFFIGIVFFRNDFKVKQHFKVRY